MILIETSELSTKMIINHDKLLQIEDNIYEYYDVFIIIIQFLLKSCHRLHF